MDADKMAKSYFFGSVGGALCIIAAWVLAQQQATLAANMPEIQPPVFADFYVPVVIGGLWGFLYLLPVQVNWFIKGIVYSVFPAVTYMAMQYGWFAGAQVAPIDLNLFLQPQSLTLFGIYAVCWGLVSAYALRDQQV